ncbi:hypothetical protein INR49_025912 [Caranx melampygus]|nr:hypothetical protein INR49_025912 [Caranx melampygus]
MAAVASTVPLHLQSRETNIVKCDAWQHLQSSINVHGRSQYFRERESQLVRQQSTIKAQVVFSEG